MKCLSTAVLVMIAVIVMPMSFAQTVQVPGNYATIQAAIDSFSGDTTPEDNVIEITTEGPFSEVITFTYPVTLRGADPSGEPTLIQARNNTTNYGIIVNNGSPYNRLENLIVVPDQTSPPLDDAIWITGAGTVCHIEKVLFCPSKDGLPVATNGFSLPDLTGAVFFGDELVFVNNGAIMHATEMILTANVAPGTGHDLLLISGNAGAGHTINKGCVFTYASRYCAQINNGTTIRGTVEQPVIIAYSRLEEANTTNGAALGFFGNNGGIHTIENLIVANANTDGVWVYTATNTNPDSLVSVDRLAVINSGDFGLSIWTGAQPLSISNSTFVNNYRVFENLDSDVIVTAVDSIFAGNGTTIQNGINITAATPATMTLTNCALVTSGPYSVAGATDVILVNSINDDPLFVNVNAFLAPSFVDVRNPAYDGKASDGGPLSGFGDYVVGELTGVESWSRFK